MSAMSGSSSSSTRPRKAAPPEADVLSIAESRHTLEDVYLELVEDTEGRTR